MNARNCRKCGKVFQASNERKLCGDCYIKTMPDFAKIRDYLYENPGSNAVQVSSALRSNGHNITPGDILDFVRDGRLTNNSIKELPERLEKKITGSFRPSHNAFGGFHSRRTII